MTTTNTRPLTAHANCDHPVTKAARAKCRKERGNFYNDAIAARRTAKPKIVLETCCCKGKPSGFTRNDDGVWVCADCDRPTKQYAMNALGALLVA